MPQGSSVERLIFDRINRSHMPLGSSPAHLSGIWGAMVAHIGPVAGCSTYNAQVLFFRYSGPRLYPLTKSVGHQTSYMPCPTTCDAHKNILWAKTRWFVLSFFVLRPNRATALGGTWGLRGRGGGGGALPLPLPLPAGSISPNRSVRRVLQRLGGSVTLRSKTANPQ
jgi:hypothetical protein